MCCQSVSGSHLCMLISWRCSSVLSVLMLLSDAAIMLIIALSNPATEPSHLWLLIHIIPLTNAPVTPHNSQLLRGAPCGLRARWYLILVGSQRCEMPNVLRHKNVACLRQHQSRLFMFRGRKEERILIVVVRSKLYDEITGSDGRSIRAAAHMHTCIHGCI